VSTAEQGDNWFAEGSGDVHRPRVFAKVAIGESRQADEHIQTVRIDGHVKRIFGEFAHEGPDGCAGLVFRRRADEDELEAMIAHHG
jgi:hypothetical protein